jgi:integrase
MRGHLRERSPGHWAIVIDIKDPTTGKRRRKWHSFHGGKREAQKRLAELITEADRGGYIEPAKVTFAAYAELWLTRVAPVNARAKAVRRYAWELRHLTGALGHKRLRDLRGDDFTVVYLQLRDRLAPGSIRNVHIVARMVLKHAFEQGDLKRPLKIAAPKMERIEARVLKSEDVQRMLAALKGSPLYPVAFLAVSTGMRRGELLGLRWQDVGLDAATVKVERSLEQTGRVVTFKAPKSARGRRTITLPAAAVACLQEHRREQLSLRMKLGLGRPEPEALVFCRHDGKPLVPDDESTRFTRAMQAVGLDIGLHSLRHYHGSELLQRGVDITTVSRRLGHAGPEITLRVYAHLVRSEDRSAEVIQEVLEAIG